MRIKTIIVTFMICLIASVSLAQESRLAKPTTAQYSWHEQGQIMFITHWHAT
jgi:Na+-transporting NADH:ubiquinone oxidoreductase subunit NqrC